MAGIAARAALGMAEDPALLEKTFQIIKTDTRDQDVISFFRGFIGNYKARRAVAEFTKKEYDAVSGGPGMRFTWDLSANRCSYTSATRRTLA